MELVGIIVVYKPDVEKLKNNIVATIKYVEKLIIYRNSEILIDDAFLKPFEDKIEYLGNGNNVGIAAALNAGVKWSIKNGFSHLLTLDQDSFFLEGHLSNFRNRIKCSKILDVGIFCPNIDNRGHLLVESAESFVKVPDSITSGSIFPLKTFIECGLFEEELFIDAVDYEFCYRIFSNKRLLTIIFPEIILNHEVGYPTVIRFGFITDNYSAFRTYHIVRNHIVMWRRYPHMFQLHYKKTLLKVHIVYRFAKILIGEQDKFAKLKSIIVGIIDGFLFKKKIDA
jgi:rhamnosyltransferase